MGSRSVWPVLLYVWAVLVLLCCIVLFVDKLHKYCAALLFYRWILSSRFTLRNPNTLLSLQYFLCTLAELNRLDWLSLAQCSPGKWLRDWTGRDCGATLAWPAVRGCWQNWFWSLGNYCHHNTSHHNTSTSTAIQGSVTTSLCCETFSHC